jgi:hypothetical protein
MPRGTMRTIYYLATGAVIAAAGVAVYAQLPTAPPPRPVNPPAVPLVPTSAPGLGLPDLPPVTAPPSAEMPPLAGTPGDSRPPARPDRSPARQDPPQVPPAAAVPAVPAPVPGVPPVPSVPVPPMPELAKVAPPAVPVPPVASEPVPVPVSPPAAVPVPPVSVPSVPVVPVPPPPLPAPEAGVPPVAVPTPIAEEPTAAVAIPEAPAPKPVQARQPATPLPTPRPVPNVPPPPELAPAVPAPTTPPGDSRPPARQEAHPPAAAAPARPTNQKIVLLQDGKLVEGIVTERDDKVVVRQGAIDRTFPKDQVQFVATGKDEVYKFQLARVTPTDAAARLKLARWCMFGGLREQALQEAREVLKLEPTNPAARDMARSLEESLRLFPEGGPPAAAPKAEAPSPAPAAAEPEPEIAPEAAATFPARVQPVLANLCMDCHARPDHASCFKLAKLTAGYDAGPQVTRQNLKAVAAQLRKDNPGASPFLVKAATPHGGMKEPAFAGRHAGALRVLEAWVYSAVGSQAAPPANPLPPAPAAGLPAVPPPSGLPPAESKPVSPAGLPAVPPPPGLPPAIPVIPPADPDPKPVIPPAGEKQTPFGVDAKLLPGPDSASGGEPVDEFDPSVFNRAVHPGGK